MKNNLPVLDTEILDSIFEKVYELETEFLPKDRIDKISYFYYTLKVMQRFNFQFRQEDYYELFELTNPIFKFAMHSEGTDLWLSLILAIKELYGLSNTMLVKVLRRVKVRL